MNDQQQPPVRDSVDEIRIQPHNIEAEEGLIASMLIDGGREILDECRSMSLNEDSLFKTSHKAIFNALCEMADNDEPIDEITLLQHMRKTGIEDDVGGISAIYSIQSRIETPAHARYYARIVMDTHLHRMIIRNSREVIENCYDQTESPAIIAGRAEEAFRQLSDSQSAGDNTMQPASVIVEESRSSLIERIKNPDAAKGLTVDTHLPDLNAALVGNGFGDGQLVIVAARPSVGKSALSGNFAEHSAIDRSLPGVIFSLEMTSIEWVERIVCTRGSTDSKRVKAGTVSGDEQKRLNGAYSELRNANLMIDDAGSSTVFDIRRKCHQFQTKLTRDGERLRYVIIDYLQLIRPSDPKRNRDEQVGEITRNLKQLAKELKCPVFLLSQLNRDAANAKPMLHNLRESGNIEQDADIVLLLHRKDSSASDQGFAPEEDDVDLIIAKQRGGPLETIRTTFVRKFTKFETSRSL